MIKKILKITIKKIIKKYLDKHEKKIDEMIKLHLQSTNERTNKISKDATEATKALDFTYSTKKLASDIKQ